MTNIEDALFWEDLSVGDSDVSPARTVTEADLVNFAGLSGDFNPIHTDRELARKLAPDGEVIVHGLLAQSIGSGLFTRTRLGSRLAGQLIAMLEISTKFVGTVKVGDTIHVVAEVREVRPTSKGNRGIVSMSRELVNQSGDVVQETTAKLMVAGR